MSEMIYGIHAVHALIEKYPERFQVVFVLRSSKNKRLIQLINIIQAHGIAIQLTRRYFLDKQSNNAVHQGIVAIIKKNCLLKEKDLLGLIHTLDNPFFLILDRIIDPHNLGACLRSADAAGVHAVIITKDCSAPLNATVKKVACGAAERVLLISVTNLVRIMSFLQKESIWIIGTSSKADHTLYQSKVVGRVALVMGAEGKGIRRLTREHCDEIVNIPTVGRWSSLNVSVATGICLFELARHRT